MLDPKKAQELEQATAMVVEMLPSLWKQLYDGCITQGFSEAQAMMCLTTYIRASCNLGGQ